MHQGLKSLSALQTPGPRDEFHQVRSGEAEPSERFSQNNCTLWSAIYEAIQLTRE